MKTHKIEIKENAVLIILYLSIIAGLMAFVPERINTILKILFITGAFVNVAKRNFVVKFGRAEKSFVFVIVLFLLQTLFSNHFSIKMLLAIGQMVTVNFLLLSQSEDELQTSFVPFLTALEKILFCGILYSIFLLFFGKTRFINGNWVNYFISPMISQIGHGLKGHLGYSSYFTNPNPFAFFISVVLVWRVINYKSDSIKEWIVLCVYAIGLKIANSRGGDICAIIGIIVVLYLRTNNVKIKKVILLGSIMASIVFALIEWNQIVNMILNIDLAGRADKWNLLIDAFKKSPIIGGGYSSSTKGVLKGISTGTFSSYLTIAAEEGIVGLIAFLVSYAIIIWNCWKQYCRNPNNPLIIFALVYALQLGVLGIVEDVFFNVTSRFLIFEITTKIALNSNLKTSNK